MNGKIVLLAVCSVWLCLGQERERTDFRGLTGVRVLVELSEGRGTGEAAERILAKFFELDQSIIQTEVELRIRTAGLAIYPQGKNAIPILSVVVSAGGRNAVHVETSLWEWATLDRGATRYFVTTWSRSVISQAVDGVRVREIIREGVSEFLNQWLSSHTGTKTIAR